MSSFNFDVIYTCNHFNYILRLDSLNRLDSLELGLHAKMKILLTLAKTLEKQKLNFSCRALFYLKVTVSLKYFVNDCSCFLKVSIKTSSISIYFAFSDSNNLSNRTLLHLWRSSDTLNLSFASLFLFPLASFSISCLLPYFFNWLFGTLYLVIVCILIPFQVLTSVRRFI